MNDQMEFSLHSSVGLASELEWGTHSILQPDHHDNNQLVVGLPVSDQCSRVQSTGVAPHGHCAEHKMRIQPLDVAN